MDGCTLNFVATTSAKHDAGERSNIDVAQRTTQAREVPIHLGFRDALPVCVVECEAGNERVADGERDDERVAVLE